MKSYKMYACSKIKIWSCRQWLCPNLKKKNKKKQHHGKSNVLLLPDAYFILFICFCSLKYWKQMNMNKTVKAFFFQYGKIQRLNKFNKCLHIFSSFPKWKHLQIFYKLLTSIQTSWRTAITVNHLHSRTSRLVSILLPWNATKEFSTFCVSFSFKVFFTSNTCRCGNFYKLEEAHWRMNLSWCRGAVVPS